MKQDQANYQPTITLLNHHATIVSSTTKVTTERYHTAFEAFINVLKNSDFAGGYLERPRSELEAHYWGYYDCLDEEVKDIEF